MKRGCLFEIILLWGACIASCAGLHQIAIQFDKSVAEEIFIKKYGSSKIDRYDDLKIRCLHFLRGDYWIQTDRVRNYTVNIRTKLIIPWDEGAPNKKAQR